MSAHCKKFESCCQLTTIHLSIRTKNRTAKRGIKKGYDAVVIFVSPACIINFSYPRVSILPQAEEFLAILYDIPFMKAGL